MQVVGQVSSCVAEARRAHPHARVIPSGACSARGLHYALVHCGADHMTHLGELRLWPQDAGGEVKVEAVQLGELEAQQQRWGGHEDLQGQGVCVCV